MLGSFYRRHCRKLHALLHPLNASDQTSLANVLWLFRALQYYKSPHSMSHRATLRQYYLFTVSTSGPLFFHVAAVPHLQMVFPVSVEK